MIEKNVSLAPYTSFKVGGPAQYLVKAHNVEDVIEARTFADRNKLKVTTIGKGSNILVGEGGIPGVVIINCLEGFNITTDSILHVNSGECIGRLARKTCKEGYKGLEWTLGIPATVGGCIVMNAGAHTKSMADVVESVTVLNRYNQLVVYNCNQLNYSYRSSILQNTDLFILNAKLRLEKESVSGEAEAAAIKHWKYRESTQPYDKPSCGSVFRNPSNNIAAKLIEDCWLKGFTYHGAQISTKHSNFILNVDNTQPRYIKAVIECAQRKVKEKFGINLIPEVKIIGEFDVITEEPIKV